MDKNNNILKIKKKKKVIQDFSDSNSTIKIM